MKDKPLHWIWLAGIVFALAISSCTAAPQTGPVETPDREATPAETSDRGIPPKSTDDLPLPEGAVISYQRSGGIAGVDETWLVYEDGRIVGPEGVEHNVEASQVAVLLADLEAAGFFGLDPTKKPLNPCCDRFTYVLIARYGELANQMTAVEAVEDVPDELWKSLQIVEAFLKTKEQLPIK